MTKWLKTSDKLNRCMQNAATAFTKEASQNIPGAQYVLNSYAFHCRPLINSMSAFLPAGFDKGKVELLFVEGTEKEKKEFDLLLLSENTDKIRKRVLISSTFGTAYKVKHVMNIFKELRNSKTQAPHLFKRGIQSAQFNQTNAFREPT